MLSLYKPTETVTNLTATYVCAVYNKLGYQWATSLLAFLTLVMTPFPYVSVSLHRLPGAEDLLAFEF